MTTADLVFRTVGERTADLALELAIRHIRPEEVHVIEDVRPLSEAVDLMRRIPHRSDFVVYVDADCLILEDLRPFLEVCSSPYVDCYVSDPFRGRIHCGVHVTRIDLVREMRRMELPGSDPAFVLRPESRLRNAALKALGERKDFKNFDILHDCFQFYRDLFAKYALRELRSRRSPARAESLELAMALWRDANGTRDFAVARAGVEHARRSVPPAAPAGLVEGYLGLLPATAATELARAGIEEKGRLDEAEVSAWLEAHRAEREALRHGPKVFGIGLSRTGTRSLTAALHALGVDTLHYPADAATLGALAAGRGEFPQLAFYDGITDITVVPFYRELDRRYPGSKFVLTVRDREPWLRSARHHWQGRSAFETAETEARATYLEVRRFLRAAVYGCYEFDAERFSAVYERHLREVQDHFAGRPDDLLVIDICGGEGWERLCPFLGRPVPLQPFPHKGQGLTKRIGRDEPTEPAPLERRAVA